ncbi:MAG TPA: DUF1501 domain-containing protein, partial [Pirellulales bacterium]
MQNQHHFLPPGGDPLLAAISRRRFLDRVGGGFTGAVAAALFGQQVFANDHPSRLAIDPVHPLRERMPHFAPKAKRVIFLFMYGGPSQVDTFDFKPVLQSLDGKPVPDAIKQSTANDRVQGVFASSNDALKASPFKFQQRGQSGLWFSELFDRLGEHADDMCFIRSLHCESSNHAPATFQMNTGEVLNGKPSMGSWVTYGLGTANENLPGFVLLFEVGGFGGAANW